MWLVTFFWYGVLWRFHWNSIEDRRNLKKLFTLLFTLLIIYLLKIVVRARGKMGVSPNF